MCSTKALHNISAICIKCTRENYLIQFSKPFSIMNLALKGENCILWFAGCWKHHTPEFTQSAYFIRFSQWKPKSLTSPNTNLNALLHYIEAEVKTSSLIWETNGLTIKTLQSFRFCIHHKIMPFLISTVIL